MKRVFKASLLLLAISFLSAPANAQVACLSYSNSVGRKPVLIDEKWIREMSLNNSEFVECGRIFTDTYRGSYRLCGDIRVDEYWNYVTDRTGRKWRFNPAGNTERSSFCIQQFDGNFIEEYRAFRRGLLEDGVTPVVFRGVVTRKFIFAVPQF